MKVKVCTGKTCKGRYSEYITKRLTADIDFHKIKGIILEESLCMGRCKFGPNVNFDKQEEGNMDPVKASKIMIDKKNGVKPKKKRKRYVKNNKK